MSTTTLEVGKTFAGEKSLQILPKYYKPDHSRMGVLYCFGYGGDAMEPRDAVNKAGIYNIMDAIANNGNPVLSADLGGNLWGNDTAISRMDAAANYLQTVMNAAYGPIMIVGESMGHTTAMAWTRVNRSRVAAVVGTIPVCDLNDIYGQVTYTAPINAAYPPSYNNATQGPTHNPLVMAQAGAFAGLPWRGYSISDDTVATYSKVGAMANAIGATATAVTLPGTGGHSFATVGKIDPQDVVNFMRANGA